MADKVKFTANERLDLLDMTRAQLAIDQITQFINKFFGSTQYYAGSGGDHTQQKAAILFGFRLTNPAGLTIRASRTYNDGTHTYNALVLDKDGKVVGNVSSAATKDYVAPAAPGATNRYLIVRHISTDTSSATRQFYTKAAGKYSAAVNTITIDDWEFSESFAQVGAHVDAANNAALRNAGWVDAGIFQTDGAGAITALDDYSPAGTLVPTLLGHTPLSWAGGIPADVRATTILEAICALEQIVARMRYGSGASSRLWDNRPLYDACFEEEGGIRFAGGQTAAVGLVDAYIRYNAGPPITLTVRPKTVATADSLLRARALSFIAGGATGGIDPANNKGFIYASDIPGTPVGIAKYASVDACNMLSTNLNTTPDPWSYGATSGWYIGDSTAANGNERSGAVAWNFGWRIKSAQGGVSEDTEHALFFPINLPHNCAIDSILVRIVTDGAGFHANRYISLYIYKRSYDVTGGTTPVLINNPGATAAIQYKPPGPVGAKSWTQSVAVASKQIDNLTYAYYGVIINGSDAGGGYAAEDVVRVCSATIAYSIREASHSYY